MSLSERFRSFIKGNNLFSPKDKLLLAVSGGVDSVVLTELCKQAGYDFAIAHCNFKLRGADSERDEQFVKDLAVKYGVTFYSKSFDTKIISEEEKKSIEETARDLRYEWFAELMTPDSGFPTPDSRLQTPDYLLTGHHADDNIETVVMNFFRGTGIKGVRGIQPKNGKIIRPLLFARRKEIEDFARESGLSFVQDATNDESTFTRNFFRNQVLPDVNKHYPEASNNILNNIKRFRETELLYEQAVAFHKKNLLETKGSEVHIPVLKLKRSNPLETIVYEIISAFGFTAHQTEEVIKLLDSETGKYISSATHRIIKNRNWMIISPVLATEAINIIIEPGDKEISFALGKLRIETTTNHKPQTTNHIAILDAKEIEFPLLLRKWKISDYFYPLGMKKEKKLNRFFIDQKLSRTEKENAWVIESKHWIIWVVGHRIDERFKINPATKEMLRFELSAE